MSLLFPGPPQSQEKYSPNSDPFVGYTNEFLQRPFLHTDMRTFPPPDPAAGWPDMSNSPASEYFLIFELSSKYLRGIFLTLFSSS